LPKSRPGAPRFFLNSRGPDFEIAENFDPRALRPAESMRAPRKGTGPSSGLDNTSRRRAPPSNQEYQLTAAMQPSKEDFTALLNESFKVDALAEGAVIKGTIVAI